MNTTVKANRGLTVGALMSPAPHTIGAGQTLEMAAERMREFGVRHLPVLDGGQLVGVLSERDIALISSAIRDAMSELKVEEAMTGIPYCVPPETPVGEVAAHMALRKLGSALVTDGVRVIGMFTTVDALQVLSAIVDDVPDASAPAMRPSGVRNLILQQHQEIRARLDELEGLVEALGENHERHMVAALEKARALQHRLQEHIDLEDSVLVPAMREADAWGDVRADALVEHHQQQRGELQELGALTADAIDPRELASRIRKLITDVRLDMMHEERGVLSPDLLRDDVVGVNVEGG